MSPTLVPATAIAHPTPAEMRRKRGPDRYPTRLTLRGRLILTFSVARAVRKVLDGRTPMLDEYDRPITRPWKLAEAKLNAVDKLLDNHGVEWCGFECTKWKNEPTGFHYSNNGDTYHPTVVLREGCFIVASWGDLVEAHERNCAACRKRQREENR